MEQTTVSTILYRLSDKCQQHFNPEAKQTAVCAETQDRKIK